MSPNTHGMLRTRETFDKDKWWRLLGVNFRYAHVSTNTKHVNVEVKNMSIVSRNKLLYKIYNMNIYTL
jgi:hypothetical protein